MSNPYINVYKGNPTAGGTNGTALSTGGDMTSPLTIVLDASINEVKTEKLAIRCETGYRTTGNTVIQDFGDTDDRWKFSLTEDGTFDDAITISSAIGAVNTIFWARASSSSLESPSRDTSVTLKVTAMIEAVG